MLGFGKRAGAEKVPRVSAKLCTERFNGKYPHVGLYDCRERKVWVAKPLNGQAIRTSHAALITGADNATSTVWKDRFLCFWFYTPRTGEGYLQGYPIDWDEAHLLVRIADAPWRTHLGFLPNLFAALSDEPALHRAADDRFTVLRETPRTGVKMIRTEIALDDVKRVIYRVHAAFTAAVK
ncbi:MAG: hypothetical protein ABSB33_07595 [Tepidisphaeraceae bacterium]